ncbi:lipoprotein-releasing system ATP-binding protein [Desulfobaculum xiamenense]|uniref:Lipoprotein-releasing system ATP-binding protein n=1 Tax=Desulfobaculum xiamenense TaxID=995050 RepID=A0A846QQV4_9BACT|nr:ABC transporter ATP-binding protein [Desulfobaculum xiamenense]NJB68872.1 lipoprotein-releasing system ATP-binding protein [Desulfobaculum xiamenense]
MNNFPLYELRAVGKEFAGPGEQVVVLRNIDMRVEEGETLAIIGASGSGKSTLLHILGTLETPSSGEVHFRGKDLVRLNGRERAGFRNREIGFVFQFHHLLPEFSALENVAMPGIISGMSRAEAFARAEEALALTGLSGRSSHRVTTLSGGERQRAAIARAILLRPKVLLADEPTGSLDERNGEKIGSLLFDLNHELGMTLVVVTHNHDLALKMNRRLELRSGELYEQVD